MTIDVLGFPLALASLCRRWMQLDPHVVYANMSAGLNATGVPMFFESCGASGRRLSCAN